MKKIMSRARAFTRVDCLALVIVTACLASMVLAANVRTREIANRVECAANLKQMGNAFLLYANENRGLFPRVVSDYSGKVTFYTHPAKDKDDAEPADPFGKDAKPDTNDLTAAMFLLIRQEGLTGDVFVCPSTTDKVDDFAGKAVNQRMNFSSPYNLSYSIVNVYPTQDAIKNGYKTFITAFSSDFATAADLNPGADLLLKLTPTASAAEQAKGNSQNHMGDGQNVLFADGHVDFFRTPLCGVDHDNIYTYGDNEGFIGSPTTKKDSVLLPTAKERPAVADPTKIPGRARRSASTQPTTQTGIIGQKFAAPDGNYVRFVSQQMVDVHINGVTYNGVVYTGMNNQYMDARTVALQSSLPKRVVVGMQGNSVVLYFAPIVNQDGVINEIEDDNGVHYKLVVE